MTCRVLINTSDHHPRVVAWSTDCATLIQWLRENPSVDPEPPESRGGPQDG